MNRMNPYEILGIPEFSNTDIVNAKFLEILEKYEQLTKLNKKQIKFLEDVRDAHETLTDEFKKSAALIRYAFQIDPYQLSIDEFYKLLEEALWLQKHNEKRMENTLMTAFAQTFSN